LVAQLFPAVPQLAASLVYLLVQTPLFKVYPLWHWTAQTPLLQAADPASNPGPALVAQLFPAVPQFAGSLVYLLVQTPLLRVYPDWHCTEQTPFVHLADPAKRPGPALLAQLFPAVPQLAASLVYLLVQTPLFRV